MKRFGYLWVVAAALGGLLAYALWLDHHAEASMAQQLNMLAIVHEDSHSDMLSAAFEHPIVFHAGSEQIAVPQKLSRTWLEQFFRSYTRRTEYRIASDQVVSYLKELAPHLNTIPVNARFAKGESGLVEAVAAQPGQTLNIEGSLRSMTQAFGRGVPDVELVFDIENPKLSLEELHAMGITTLIGRGESNFVGSSGDRVHNIKIGASKFDHTLIQPGEEFSFNTRLGDVDAEAGYVPGLVIKGTKLIPEYGGGICQVATTMFRAAAYAGLAIVERHPHSLPVRFYNPQGFDATIYPGVVDLRFRNDTAAPILIQSVIKGTTLAFELYGAADGRTTQLVGPTVLESNPDGSLKTILTRTVTFANESVHTDRFYSSYKAPALFETVRNPLE